ncbi:MAG: DEAD/DEAH box helicase [Candidatus Izemoplasmatales bacterium]|nr:DEAD/DEAH box helicase [Candidatus Izemoplasmatales bacterium]MDD4988472.1 DEAD/DEAH box helicase [Candidatus Izemoplasmatales bacterium]
MEFQKEYLNQSGLAMGFKELTEVQKRVIPLVREKKDLIVEAKTGSGKTHAYLFPIFERLNEEDPTCQSLIIAPTKDLAKQIFAFAKMLTDPAIQPVDIRLYIGGSDRDEEIERLKLSQPQIAIGTPGKLHDLIRKENVLKVHTTAILVIDEADMTLDHEFLFDVDQIASAMPEKLQILVFSATIPVGIQPFLKKYLHQPEILTLATFTDHNLSIRHYFIKTKEQDRLIVLNRLLATFQPYLAMIFCNTKASAETTYAWIKDTGASVALIHGGIPYRQRKQIMERILRLDFSYVVTTDILSRGIDIPSISHIINFELPEDPGFYIHRSGRTGRMDANGICYSLYAFKDNQYVSELEKRGIHCEFRDLSAEGLVATRGLDARKQREKRQSPVVTQAIRQIPKPTKVKPGYKKKYLQDVSKKQKTLFSRKGKTR